MSAVNSTDRKVSPCFATATSTLTIDIFNTNLFKVFNKIFSYNNSKSGEIFPSRHGTLSNKISHLTQLDKHIPHPFKYLQEENICCDK